MNAPCTEQNSELQLDRLAAQRSLYGSAKQSFAWHAFLSTIVASGLSFSALFWDGMKPVAALWGMLLTGIDYFILAPWQKKLREQAASIQESFDCDVLGLPWESVVGEKPVDPELVVERAALYRRKEPSFASLRDWYPTDVCRMPLFLARVVCQRINAWWDAKQRRRYAYFLVSGVAVLVLTLIGVGIARSMKVLDLLVTALVPLSSGIWLALRQFRENNEAAARLDKLKEHARGLWERALKGASEGELTLASRTLQNELFNHRKRNVPVFDFLYWRLRADHETQMHEAAARLVRELEAARGDGT